MRAAFSRWTASHADAGQAWFESLLCTGRRRKAPGAGPLATAEGEPQRPARKTACETQRADPSARAAPRRGPARHVGRRLRACRSRARTCEPPGATAGRAPPSRARASAYPRRTVRRNRTRALGVTLEGLHGGSSHRRVPRRSPRPCRSGHRPFEGPSPSADRFVAFRASERGQGVLDDLAGHTWRHRRTLQGRRRAPPGGRRDTESPPSRHEAVAPGPHEPGHNGARGGSDICGIRFFGRVGGRDRRPPSQRPRRTGHMASNVALAQDVAVSVESGAVALSPRRAGRPRAPGMA